MVGREHVRTDERHHASRLVLSQILELSGTEAAALSAVRRWGTRGLTLRLTAGSVASSLVITAILMLVLFGPTSSAFLPGLAIGAVVPALVAPPIIIVIARLISRLDEMGEKLAAVATTDPLTGVYNRRGFFDELDSIELDDGPLSVAMLDIDEFKQLNDRHGHAGGDAVLRHVANWLQRHADGRGVVARLGGDEFVLVASSSIVNRLNGREIFTVDDVTASATIGIAPMGDRGFDEALADADATLYRHKATRG